MKEIAGPISSNIWPTTGMYRFLVKSFKPSITGCSTPNKANLLGPSRIWEKPSNFRSNKVKKATNTNPEINRINVLIIHNIMID